MGRRRVAAILFLAVTLYTYDAEGRRTSVTDANGHATCLCLRRTRTAHPYHQRPRLRSSNTYDETGNKSFRDGRPTGTRLCMPMTHKTGSFLPAMPSLHQRLRLRSGRQTRSRKPMPMPYHHLFLRLPETPDRHHQRPRVRHAIRVMTPAPVAAAAAAGPEPRAPGESPNKPMPTAM